MARISFLAAPGNPPAVMRLSGELDLGCVPMVEHAVRAARHGSTDVVLDLSGLRFCDCAGVAMYVRLSSFYAAAGGVLVLTGPQGIVATIFAMVDLAAAVPIHASTPEAINAMCRGSVVSTPVPVA